MDSRAISQAALASAAARLQVGSVLATIFAHQGRPFSDQNGSRVKPTFVGLREVTSVLPVTVESGDFR